MEIAFLVILSAVCLFFATNLINNAKKEEKRRQLTDHWINMATGSIVNEFPTLDVKLKVPIKNARYYFDGKVPSIAEYEKWVAKKFGQEFDRNTDDKRAGGRCVRLKLSDGIETYRICVVFVREGLSEVDDLFITAHEEFHVAQYLGATEVFEALCMRLKQRGFDVDWNDFSFEEQANVAGILIALECGLKKEDILELISIHANGISTYGKLQKCEIS